MADLTDRGALLDAIHSSPGAVYINRTHSRSFSLNIFRRNAEELIAATWNVRDPDQGLQLMALENREAGQQAHREINRLVHNFVASAMTLIEHTRQFMRQYYADTPVQEAYDDRVKADFASEPVAKFVQDLRNYMLHKGLPASQMFIEFRSAENEAGRGDELKTGVRYESAALLDWDGWTAPARAYIAAGEHLDVHVFAESYLEKVLRFYAGLEVELQNFHAADLNQLKAMQDTYARLSGESAKRLWLSDEQERDVPLPDSDKLLEAASDQSPTPALDSGANVQRFEFPSTTAANIDAIGNSILDKIRRLDFATRSTGDFASERPTSTITQEALKETPILRGNDVNGRSVVAFMTSGNEAFGLDANVFAELLPLADKILEICWAKSSLSRKFIEEIAIHWLRSSFRSAEQQTSFSSVLSSASRDQVGSLDFWAPIACLEVEEAFEFGPVKIAPITKAMIDELETKGLKYSPNQHDDVKAMFKNLRSKMQGFAGVVVRFEAEPRRAYEDGMVLAQNAVGILRFFSPAALELRRVSPVALLGSEAMPRAQALVLGDDYFSFSDGLISSPFFWRLSKETVRALWEAGLGKASCLISPDGLDEFRMSVRASLLLYGTGATLVNPADRLIYALSSLEGLLLKHSMEASELNVEERMSLLLGHNKKRREEVAQNVREMYRFRKRHGASVLTPQEQASMAMFASNAYGVLCTALENINVFSRKADFIDAIGRRKTVNDNEAT